MDTEFEMMHWLTVDYISDRSATILIRDSQGNYSGIGTAICIKIGSRYFLATAGHVISGCEDSQLELLPRGDWAAPLLRFNSRCCDIQQPYDVAWIELAHGSITEGGQKYLDLDDLRISEVNRGPEGIVLCQGFPAEMVEVGPEKPKVQSLLAYTMLIEPAEVRRTIEPYKLVLEYPPRDGSRVQSGPKPQGMSGGGVWWHPRHETSGLFSPTNFKLIGINISWHSQTSMLSATKIGPWLRIVGNSFPDTVGAIAAVFPEFQSDTSAPSARPARS